MHNKPFFFTKMPIQKLIDPNQSGYFCHIVDSYWAITDNQEVIFYGTKQSPYQSPQCNTNKSIAERFKQGPKEQGIIIVGTRLIPIAFTPIKISDYQY